MDSEVLKKVDHPSYYNRGGKECIDEMIDRFGIPGVICFCLCNEYKYNYRAGFKPTASAEEDSAKAMWYHKKAEELIQQLI